MGGIELSDDDLREVCAIAIRKSRGAAQLYESLLVELRQKVPTLASETIAAVKKAMQDGSYRDDGGQVARTAFCCAWYQLAADRCAECLGLLALGRANAEVIRNLFAATPEMFSALGAVAAYVNGGPQIADAALADIQAAYDREYEATGKSPSQRAVTERSGYDRATVRKRWSRLKPTKTNHQNKPK